MEILFLHQNLHFSPLYDNFGFKPSSHLAVINILFPSTTLDFAFLLPWAINPRVSKNRPSSPLPPLHKPITRTNPAFIDMDLWLAIPPPATQLPSFFELSLLRLLKDALISASGNHLDTAIRKVGLAGWEEEARAVARGAVEWRSVSKGDGLVGEGSYGLKRSRVVGDGQGRRMEDMRTGDQIRAVAMAVAVGWGRGGGGGGGARAPGPANVRAVQKGD